MAVAGNRDTRRQPMNERAHDPDERPTDSRSPRFVQGRKGGYARQSQEVEDAGTGCVASGFGISRDSDYGDDGCCRKQLRYLCNLAIGRSFALPDSEYNPTDWFQTVFVWNGSVLPSVATRVVIWGIYAYLVYRMQLRFPDLEFESKEAPKAFSALAIFFTIFRLNSAHARYRDGVMVFENCVDCIRSINRKIISHMGRRQFRDRHGHQMGDEEKLWQRHAKCDMLRFTIATGLLMKLQGRISHSDDNISRSRARLIELDIMRVRGLLVPTEFEALKKVMGAIAPWTKPSSSCQAIVSMMFDCEDSFVRTCKHKFPLHNWGIQHLTRAIATACFHKDFLRHGFVERMLNLFENNIETIETCGTRMLNAAIIPVPIAYIQLARILLVLYLLVFPFQIRAEEGIFVNTFFPTMIALIFNGMDQICTNMEDPHGDDASDLKLVTPLQDIESEMMTMLEETGDEVYDMFTWKSPPHGDEWLLPRGVDRYLCLVSEYEAVETMEADCRADLWSDHVL